MSPAPDPVIVVGGAGSIGAAVVTRYRRRGVEVIVIDRDLSPIGAVVRGDDAVHLLAADVTDDGDITATRARIEREGWQPRHVVSLAGGALDPEFGALVETDVDTIRASVELNLTSHVMLTRAFLPLVAGDADEDGPEVDRSITFVSSINALRDYGLPAYSAAKAGLFGFVHAMVSEAGAMGVRMNVVVPGTVATGATSTQPKDLEALRRGTALGRLTTPDDVAVAVTALSHDLRAVTGQLLVVDCGQTVATPDWRSTPGATPSRADQP